MNEIINIFFNSSGRSHADEQEIIDPQYMELWEKANNSIGNLEYKIDQFSVSITCNWNNYFQHVYSKKRNERELILKAELTISENYDKSESDFSTAAFVERYLYDVFFITNLALPGTFNLYNVAIENDLGYKIRLHLSSVQFENLLIDSIRYKWPSVKIIPLDKVRNWYMGLKIGFELKSRNSIERALFAIFKICKSDDEGVTSIIWIFYALESIYKTNVGEGFTNLITRLSTFLELSSDDKAYAKKNLRELYTIRSKFVHGSLEINNFSADWLDNEDVEIDFENQYKSFSFGFSLLILTVQQMIFKNYKLLEIKEEIIGIEL